MKLILVVDVCKMWRLSSRDGDTTGVGDWFLSVDPAMTTKARSGGGVGLLDADKEVVDVQDKKKKRM